MVKMHLGIMVGVWFVPLSTQHVSNQLLPVARLSPANQYTRFQTLQCRLTSPAHIDKLPGPRAPAELAAMSLRERAEAELKKSAALVQHDNLTYPMSNSLLLLLIVHVVPPPSPSCPDPATRPSPASLHRQAARAPGACRACRHEFAGAG